LQLDELGVELDPKGFVKTDKKQRTNVQNIFAIGDVTGGPLLAHKASKEGIVAAEVISGLNSSFDNVVIPSVIFTDPEIAVAGVNSGAQDAANLATGKFPFSANGRALSTLEPEGFVKVSAEKDTGRILKVEIVGNEASDLISEAVLAMEMGASLEDVALTIHSHPTLPEAFMEASENALGRAIHIQNRKQ
jgi:dihydrolipoamide dehydrogenase